MQQYVCTIHSALKWDIKVNKTLTQSDTDSVRKKKKTEAIEIPEIKFPFSLTKMILTPQH